MTQPAGSMGLQATVLVPSHEHGQTLAYSVRSALTQTVAELEVLIVGDGVPEAAREVVAQLVADDERVRFFDNPKGPRHGEIHRHTALQHARGRCIFYLSDDDLWLPDHVEGLLELLDRHNFTHSLGTCIYPDGCCRAWPAQLSVSWYRELLLSGRNRVPLSTAAHTKALYDALPHGWRTTPEDTYTDLYMWQQLLAHPDCRATSGTRPTVLHFPSPFRRRMSNEERLAELRAWSERLTDLSLRVAMGESLLTHLNEQIAGLESGHKKVANALPPEGAFARATSPRPEHVLRRAGELAANPETP